MFLIVASSKVTLKRRGGEKVIVCLTGLSARWNLVMPRMRRHTSTTKEQQSIEKYANADCCYAPRDGKRWLIEMRFGDCHRQKVHIRTQDRDGQQTDYYLVNHGSSEGPTVGI